jgi:hypothetical protein
MSDLHELAPEKDRSGNGAARIVDLQVWRELRIPATPKWLQETSASESGDTGRAAQVDQGQMTPIDQQLEQMQALATRHYPDCEGERNACLVRLLTERLRTYHTMLQPLPVKQMREE